MRIARFSPSLLVVCLTSMTRLHGELVEGADPRFGAGSLTMDTRTGLSWLDLPLSVGLSFAGAETEMLPGGRFDGYRHATLDEVSGLLWSLGVDSGYISPSSPSFHAVESALSIFGATEFRDGDPGGTYPTAYAISGPILADSLVPVPYLFYGWRFEEELGYYVAAAEEGGLLSYGLNTSAATVGNWLVAVPEPSALSLAVAGGVALIAIRSVGRKCPGATAECQ